MTDQQLIDQTIQMFTANGWQVAVQSPSGIQFRKPFKPNMTLAIIGIFTAPLCIGILLLIMAFVGSDKTAYVTIEQMRAGDARDIMLGHYVDPSRRPSRS